jgi:flagellar hook-associated protein 2
MASISSIGIGSGLDIESMITQLIAVERAPVTKLQTEATSLQTKLSTYGKLQSSLAALRDAASVLTRSSTWGATVGSSSDAASVAATTSSTTLPGSYAVEVQRLAAVQSNATGVYASADALVGEGTLHIELGT